MRDEFLKLAVTYPKSPERGDPAFTRSPIVAHLEHALPAAITAALGAASDGYQISASAGQGGWTHTPWVVLLDPAVASSVEEGFYVVYLMSKGGERLYLSLNQGCTTLKNAIGLPGARDALARRAEVMWSRAKSAARRLGPIKMDLNVEPRVWRGRLYELGAVAGASYDTDSLPSEDDMRSDLLEALMLYSKVKLSGGWDAEDAMIAEARGDGAGETLEQAKRYRQHRAIERQPSHSRKVKRALGTRCMGCEFELGELYGAAAKGVADAHHLVPLSSLGDGTVVRFDPKRDFAVLCPNCHRAIHRMPDPSDLNALRAEIAKGALGGSRPS